MAPLHLALTGGLFLSLGLPLALKKVAPNLLYGFRTPRTLSSRAIWYAANRVAGIDLCLAGVAILLFSALQLQGLVNLAALLLALFTAVAHSLWALSKMR